MTRTILARVRHRIWWNWKIHVARDSVVRATRDWQRQELDKTLRLDYPLSSGSVVFDVGGFKGDWTRSIVARYAPRVYVFEPLPEYAERLRMEFASNPKVRVHPFALGAAASTAHLSVMGDGSSLFRAGKDTRNVAVRDIAEFMDSEAIDSIDLIKINIEGGEYVLLRRMIDLGLTKRCRDIQVQFHTFYPDAVRLRDALRADLTKTHYLTYDYQFVWENWRRRDAPSR